MSLPNDYAEKEYAAIGRFIVTFEELMEEIKGVVGDVLTNFGLHHATVRFSITAEIGVQPLVNLFRTLLYLQASETDYSNELQAIVKALAKDIKQFVETRNQVAHGRWQSGGYAYDPETKDFTRFVPPSGLYLRHSAEGITARDLPTYEQFEKLIDDVQATIRKVNRLSMMIRSIKEEHVVKMILEDWPKV